MRFSETVLLTTAFVLTASAQSSAPSAPDAKCAAAVNKCLTPDATCVSSMCSACSNQLPCCSQPQASQLPCFQAQASAAASMSNLPTITNTAQLTSDVACTIAALIGNACAAATTNFPSLANSDKASCLCYQTQGASQAAWAPDFFDAAVAGCATYLSSQGSTSAASFQSVNEGICSKAGNLRSLPALTAVATAAAPSGAAGSAAGTAAGTSADMPTETGSSASPSTTDGAKKSFAAPSTGGLSKGAMALAGSAFAILGLALQL